MIRRFPPTRLAALLLPALPAGAHDAESQSPFEYLHAHGRTEGHFHAGWESRYASEGRDALDGDSLFAASLEFGWEHWAVGAWYGNSPDQRYDELQLSAGWVQSIGALECYLAYTHLRTPFEGGHDHEIGAGLVWGGLPWELELGLEGYHSLEADGSFWELSLARPFQLAERISLAASGALGFNQGYVADGHDGPNHLALRLAAIYEMTEAWSLTAHATYNFALDRQVLRPGDALLKDFFHGGFGVEWSF